MKTQSWKFQLNGVNYTVEATAKEFTVTPGETCKIVKLKRTGNMLDQQYEVPVADSLIYLHVDMFGKKNW